MHSRAGVWFDRFNVVFMIVICLVFIIPFIVVISTSVTPALELARRGAYVLYPESLDFSAYKALLYWGSPVYQAYGVTLFRTIVGTFFNLLVTAMLAYGLSKRDLPGNVFLTTFVFITMLFNGGLIPTYMVVKYTGLTNTVWAMIVPNLVVVWNLLVLRTFFAQIPEALEESATIDGASQARVLFSIVLPLSLPALATVGLFYAVWHWNSWFDATIYIHNAELQPVQNIMRNMVIDESNMDLNMEILGERPPATGTMKSAIIIVSTIPILCVYPFLQRYFIKGVMVGAVKG